MVLRHTTTRNALADILAQGLRTDLARQLPIADLVVLDVSVPRRWLTRARTGVWVCARPIPPGRITAIRPVELWANQSQ